MKAEWKFHNLVRVTEMLKRQKFFYIDQRLNYNDLIMFIVLILLDIALFTADLMITTKGDKDFVGSITITVLMFIFNVPIMIHFAAKAIKMFRFRNKIRHFKENGKMFRARIVDERLGKPIFKSDVATINSYHPVVKFYDPSVQREVTLISEIPLCASYKQALMSNGVTIRVIGNSFLITSFSPADEKEYSLERRTIKSNKETDNEERIERSVQTVYAVGALIFAILMLGLKFLFSWLMRTYVI